MTVSKKYSKEFKLDAISLVLEQCYSQAEAARNLGLNAMMLSRWLQEHQADAGQAFLGNGKLTAEQLAICRLREEHKRLKLEKDILTKAEVFFAKETN